SDLALAVVFEPILLMLVRLGSRAQLIRRAAEVFRKSLDQNVARYGHVTGPFGLVLVAFGVDPMTGRAAALAAGHGFVTGWMIAIAGDMMYFTVLMVSTLWLKQWIGDGTVVMLIVFVLMMSIPALIRKIRERRG
ncbi:hypothetical protein EBZ37_02390, partial [bacterium]|nr:hypothetical protein [bacterium]